MATLKESKITVTIALTFVLVLGAIPLLTSSHARETLARVLVQGSPINMANGIMFDSEDRLHIASSVGREILVMDPETGEILNRLGTDLGVEGPDDLAFGPDGSLYWTAIMTGEVGRLSPDGVKSGQMVAPGVNPITFSDDGRLFVALDYLGDALYELDPNLIDPPRLIAKNLGWLNGMDWGPDGFLYGPLCAQGRVVRVDVDQGTVTTVANGLFGVPVAVKFDSQGRLHVVDQLRGEILRVDTETGSKEVIATLPPGLDNLAFDSQDRLFVSHYQDGSIFEVFPDGTTRTVSPGGMIAAGSVAVMARPDGESVFVADLFTLREFDGLTGEERTVERHCIGVPGITSPMTVSPDGNNLVLSSWFANAVQVWNPETREALEEYLDFAVPLNAIRFQGDLIVAELGFKPGAARVVRASAAGRVTLVDSADGLAVPAGLAATDDDLWVSDWATGMVLQLVANGEPLATPIQVATGLLFPDSLALDLDGNLLVVEPGAKRLSRIDIRTGEVSTVAKGLDLGAQATPGLPPTWGVNGVTVGSSGAIYITGELVSVLYRIEPRP